jgi:acyl-CoA synthetase (AMP-forming)/AMP-acid ligase II
VGRHQAGHPKVRPRRQTLIRPLTSLKVLADAGLIRPYRPSVLLQVARTLHGWGLGVAGGYAAAALRMPDQLSLIDDIGTLTFSEVQQRTNSLARALSERGVVEGDSVALMCRNHRGFVEATVATAKLGADVVYLNTAFARSELVDVLDRGRPRVLVFDEEFAPLVSGVAEGIDLIVARHESGEVSWPTLAELIRTHKPVNLTPPRRVSRTVILTSGTTGSPKGVSRGTGSVAAAVALLSSIPLKYGQRCHVAAPLFHAWGWAHFQLGMLLGSTLVLRRRFDPEGCLAAVAEQRCDSLVAVPVMLQRILELPERTLRKYDTGSLRVVAVSGSSLSGDLAARWMDVFGDTLYNVYGSTECAWATIAGPTDLRAAPGTAGRTQAGTEVRLYDDGGQVVAPGQSGRIFVGNAMMVEGSEGSGGESLRDGLMATGDLGRFDASGRLTVEGRVDEMIVSGGENVYPQEVEDCLVRHPAVREAAVIGVADTDFGQRLRAFVVTSSPISSEELRTYLTAELARYKVPRDVWFLDELPRNDTGKVLKRELVQLDGPSA